MSDEAPPGPEVAAEDNLFRCITTPTWWVSDENRPSSAAFRHPDFSTDMESIAKEPAYTLARFPKGCGLVSFNYGTAKALGFIARQESDPAHPENLAHANVYSPTSTSERKRAALKLVDAIVAANGVRVPPSFPEKTREGEE